MKTEKFYKGQVLLYNNRVEVRLENETVWLTQEQMADLFGKGRTTITEHIQNVFRESELDRKLVCREFRRTGSDGKEYVVLHYNLDVIISVGYRVKSLRGTQFRIWATNVLRKHLVDGYTINEKRLKLQVEKIDKLQEAVRLLANITQAEGVPCEMKGVIQIIQEYSRGLAILDDFDHERLTVPVGTKKSKFKLTYEQAMAIIEQMKLKFNDSSLVGQEKDDSFKSSLETIYQTFSGKELYPTVEEKAAYLLYFIVKNHSFVDGNKRIAAAIFICYLQKNGLLLRKNGVKRIDDNALAALTLMVASSRSAEKDLMVKVILNLMI